MGHLGLGCQEGVGSAARDTGLVALLPDRQAQVMDHVELR